MTGCWPPSTVVGGDVVIVAERKLYFGYGSFELLSKSLAFLSLVKNVPVNYAVRFSGPVTALTARRVRYGVGPDLICQPGPSPGIKTYSSPAAFPTTLSLSFVPFPSLTFLHRPLVPQAALSSTYSPARPPSPHRTDTTRPVGKMSQRDG